MGAPAARITDMHTCPMVTPGLPPIPHVGGPIVAGAPTVLIGSLPAARVGDMLVCVGPPDSIVKVHRQYLFVVCLPLVWAILPHTEAQLFWVCQPF